MDQEAGFHRAERAIEPLIRPLHHFGLSGLEGAGEEGSTEEQAGAVWNTSTEEVEEDKVQTPAIPHDPGRPTRKIVVRASSAALAIQVMV